MDLDSGPDGYQAALGAGNRAADNQHVQLGIDLDHAQVLDGDLLDAHLAGADLALEDLGGVAVGAHGAGVTADGAAAVGLLQAVGAVALDDAGVAVALGDAGDIHEVAGLEGVGLDDVADVQLGGVVQVELTQVLLGGSAGLVQVAHLGLAQLALGDILEAQLDSLIAFLFGSLLLHDHAGTRLDDGDGDHMAVLVKNLGHAHFFADDRFHVYSSLKVIGRLRYARVGSRRHCSADMTRPSRKTMDLGQQTI